MADCSEDLHARRLWNDVLRVLKDDNCQPRLLHLARFSFTAGEVKTFCGKDKWRELTASRPELQKMLKSILYPEEKEPGNPQHWEWE